MNSRIKHIDSVDHLRGAALIAVLVYHVFLYTFGGDHGELPWNGWIRSFSVPEAYLWFLPFSISNCGVPIFFVVSGFCIHLSFEQQGHLWTPFYLRRFVLISNSAESRRAGPIQKNAAPPQIVPSYGRFSRRRNWPKTGVSCCSQIGYAEF